MDDPAAAVQQLPRSVNDLVIALQLLATARRPASLAQYRRYEAAVGQVAAAVLERYKALLLSPDGAAAQPGPHLQQQDQQDPLQQQQQQQQQWQDPMHHDHQQQQQQQRLAAAVAALPATKVAATAFSLGVLRRYDTQLVPALEAGSLQLLQRGAFKANQLGQLAQGFAYLDHTPGPEWQARFRDAARGQMRFMQGPQLASLAVWVTSGLARDCNNAASSSSSGGGGSRDSSGSGTVPAVGVATDPTAPAGAAAAPPTALDADWVAAYLTAVGRQAATLGPQQLPQVLQAAAGLYQQQQQQSQYPGVNEAAPAGAGSWGEAPGAMRHSSSSSRSSTAVFAGLPLDLSAGGSAAASAAAAVNQQHQQHRQQWGGQRPPSSNAAATAQPGSSRASSSRSSHGSKDSASSARSPEASSRRSIGTNTITRGSSGSNDGASSWLLPLLAALHQQLPELKMGHLAVALSALAQLTACPWPERQPLLGAALLQTQLLLPGCSGADLVAVTHAFAQLAGPGHLAAQQGWCDAVLTRLHAVLGTLGPAGLASAVQAAALMRVRPYRAWLYALCQRLRVHAAALTGPQLLALLEGLAGLGVVLDPEVLHLMVLGLRRCMGRMARPDLARAAAALRAMYPKVLPGRSVQQLVEELERRVAFLALQEQQRMGRGPL